MKHFSANFDARTQLQTFSLNDYTKIILSLTPEAVNAYVSISLYDIDDLMGIGLRNIARDRLV